ncbi:DHH family phosphoesterase [candidate division TA06 bacterium]|nr:DHH family phosphoesterase [candidate division TA06 bacterium]
MTASLENYGFPASPAGWASLQKAAGAILNASRENRTITIWGHDDLDGIAGTSIMLDALRGKTEVNYYIPPKNGVHYGLDIKIIDKLIADGTGLIITVDGGISNHSEAQYCRDKGLPLIITDHHELPAVLPPATELVNPKIQEAGSPYANLCGAAVALYLAAAMDGAGSDGWLQANSKRLAWAALATVSDRVPLLEENRMILRAGLKVIPEDSVLARLACMLGFDLSRGLSPLTLQNSFIPLFSASQSQGGRHPMVELLLGSIDEITVKDLWTKQIDWRRRFGQELKKKLAAVNDREMKIMTVVDPELQGDMIGPLAGGLRDSLNLPAIVVGKKGTAYVGEARGYLPFDFVEMLSGFKDYFIQYGGHKQAAGFTLKPGALEEFIPAVERYSAGHRDLIRSSRPDQKYDHRFDDLAQLSERIPQFLENSPYGAGNPWPLCLIGNIRLPEGAAPDQSFWLDELLPLQRQVVLPAVQASVSLDATSTGRISLSIKAHQLT